MTNKLADRFYQTFFRKNKNLLWDNNAMAAIMSHDATGVDLQGTNRTTGNKSMYGGYLNCCSLPLVEQAVIDAVQEAKPEELDYSDRCYDERIQIANQCREVAARLVNAPSPDHIILAENTTTVSCIVKCLCGILEDDFQYWTTNCANMGTIMATDYIGDYRNQFRKKDVCTTYNDWHLQNERNGEYRSVVHKQTKMSINVINVWRQSLQDIKEQILHTSRSGGPSIFEIDHVLKQDGTILPIKEIIDCIRSKHPQAIVIVDAAQSFANLPQIDLQEMGADFVVFPGHKAFGSIPLGVAAWLPSERSKRSKQIATRMKTISQKTSGILNIHPETFSPDLHDRHNTKGNVTFPIGSAIGFCEADKFLREEGMLTGDNDFSNLDEHRRRLRELCKQRLLQANMGKLPISIVESEGALQSNFILAYRMGKARGKLEDNEPGLEYLLTENFYDYRHKHPIERCFDMRWEQALIRRMARRGMEASFLRPRKLFRASFARHTSDEEVNHFVDALTLERQEVEYFLSLLPGPTLHRMGITGRKLVQSLLSWLSNDLYIDKN